MIRALLLSLALAGAPAEPASPAAAPPAAARQDAPADPQVRIAVERMQRFYEETRDFTASFQQAYAHKAFASSRKASGQVRFLKAGGSMRWDYRSPEEKSFVISGKKVYVYEKEARQLTISPIDTDRLSASVTFLWGQGRLDREFDIRKAERQDLGAGIALELTPKVPDPRFREIFFLLDPGTYAVRESLVVDPDGSENRVTFSDVKTNTGFAKDVFRIEYPKDTQIVRLDGEKKAPPTAP